MQGCPFLQLTPLSYMTSYPKAPSKHSLHGGLSPYTKTAQEPWIFSFPSPGLPILQGVSVTNKDRLRQTRGAASRVHLPTAVSQDGNFQQLPPFATYAHHCSEGAWKEETGSLCSASWEHFCLLKIEENHSIIFAESWALPDFNRDLLTRWCHTWDVSG